MNSSLPTISLLLTIGVSAAAQSVDTARTDTVYSEKYLRRSASFAWLTLGADVLTLTGGRTDYQTPDGAVRSAAFGPSVTPRLTIGGIHFWGHADFYVSFPVGQLPGSRPEALSALRHTNGVETGARVYPLRLQPGRLSPYVGISMRLQTYGHQTAGTTYAHGYPVAQQTLGPLQAGLTYTTRRLHLTAGLHYQVDNTVRYAISPTQFGTTTLHPLSVTVGLVRYIDTDRRLGSAAGAQQQNARHALLKRLNRMSFWYAGFGPSSAIQRSRSSYFERYHPYLAGEMTGGLMPDLTAGRHFGRLDVNVGVSYRSLRDRVRGFETDTQLGRRSFMLEAYKFVANYHGFVPFIGPTLSLEALTFSDNGRPYREQKLRAGLIFGWDIRVTRTGTSMLRTNLRWVPNLHLTAEGERVMFDHLEFNFIQYVHYFGRAKLYRQNGL